MTNLIEKYGKAGPRYTSFPPVPFWNEAPSQSDWFDHISLTYGKDMGIDLYIHIPFCESLCFYCGCHRTITKNKDRGLEYAEYIIKEWDIYEKNLGELKLNSLHFGGGTPTFLSPNTLKKLLSRFSHSFTEDFLGSIEIDPRTCEEEHLKVLKEFGFKRVSLGIQDFDEKVQKSINRFQSVKLIDDLVSKIKDYEFESINFDLIYGLPNQTKESITNTIKEVKDLNPDLIAFYSYAHLPDKLKNQKLINEDELPLGEAKRELYELGKKLLIENGYIEIGLDHFAKPSNYLGESFNSKTLKRNFMGYTDKKSENLVGLGVSSISNSKHSFIQNEKEIKKYMEYLDNNTLPITKGHILTQSDIISSEIIHDLMCNGVANISKVSSTAILNKLEEMKTDGILDLNDNELKISNEGHPFIRNVAMVFDQYLVDKRENIVFSQTI
jgi:oxygen-independent coproporphyrinogen III oxidase